MCKQKETFECSCMVFELYGILCRHIVCVMKKNFINEIPKQYLLRRWGKQIMRSNDLVRSLAIGDSDNGNLGLVNELYYVVSKCVEADAHDKSEIK